MATEITRTSPKEFYSAMQRNPGEALTVMEDAQKNRVSVSRELNKILQIDERDSLDGYEQLLKAAGIRTKSKPELGLYASKASQFLENATTRFLLVEYVARRRRAVLNASAMRTQKIQLDMGQVQKLAAAPASSGGAAAGDLARPYFDAMEIEWTQRIAPSIPLERVVSMSQGIDARDYRSYHITYDVTALRLYRTGEATDLPELRLVSSDHTINLKKYGRLIRASYEWLNQIPVDELGATFDAIFAQLEVDKLAAFIDIATNGDGNANTAATNHNLTALDTDATAGSLSGKGWSVFKKKFTGIYILTTALMQDHNATELELVNVGSADFPLVHFPRTGITPINAQQDIEYGWTADATTDVILGLDNRFSPKHLFWVAADIQESQRFVQNQTEIFTVSEYSGFAVRDPNGARTLTISA